ncbi:MAG: hypothetical protein AAF378_02925 [Cyanobacteria bacterium P01_A01_bin.84]
MSKLYKSSIILFSIVISILLEMPLKAVFRPKNQTQLSQVKSTHLALSWADIVKIFRRKKSRKGGKGSICLIVPQKLDDPISQVQGTQEVWSVNPLFLWNIKKGKLRKIELFEKGNTKPFWSREVPEGKTSFIYDGKPLQPGSSYEWRIIANAPFRMKSIPGEFKVMEPQKRLAIAIRLALLEHRLEKQGADAEKTALEKASYFAQRELWSDVVGEIYKVKGRSTRLKQMKQQIQSSDYCNKTGTFVSVNSSK